MHHMMYLLRVYEPTNSDVKSGVVQRRVSLCPATGARKGDHLPLAGQCHPCSKGASSPTRSAPRYTTPESSRETDVLSTPDLASLT
jgi:hypothetical protein